MKANWHHVRMKGIRPIEKTRKMVLENCIFYITITMNYHNWQACGNFRMRTTKSPSSILCHHVLAGGHPFRIDRNITVFPHLHGWRLTRIYKFIMGSVGHACPHFFFNKNYSLMRFPSQLWKRKDQENGHGISSLELPLTSPFLSFSFVFGNHSIWTSRSSSSK